jgi:ATPase subunit of ABC transporter with duplicated ATPase domains
MQGWILELIEEKVFLERKLPPWLEQKIWTYGIGRKSSFKRRKNLERELDWVRQGQRTSNETTKARLQNYDKLLNEDQKALDENQKLYPERSPFRDKCYEAKGVAKAYGDKLMTT